jgi:pimeloyl-ACP methyl ester carboxylesterase
MLSMPMSRRTFRRIQDLALGDGALNHEPPSLAEALRLLMNRRANAASIAAFYRALLHGGSIRPGVALTVAELGDLKQPVLFAWGDRDVIMTPAAARASIAAIPDSRLVRLPAGGHAPWLQEESTVGCAIAEHLKA